MSNFIMHEKIVPNKEGSRESYNKDIREEIEKTMDRVVRMDARQEIKRRGLIGKIAERIESVDTAEKSAERKAAFFDVDGTLLKGAIICDFAGYLTRKGFFDKKVNDNIKVQEILYGVGFINYRKVAERIPELYAAGIKGQKQSEIIELASEFMKEYRKNIPQSSKDLVSLMNKKGLLTVGISGSPIETVSFLKDYLGFKEVHGSEMEVVNGVYTGRVKKNLGVQEEKYELLNSLIERYKINSKDSFAFGDTEQDLRMLSKVGNPYLLNPSTGANEWRQRFIKASDLLKKRLSKGEGKD